MKRNRIWLLVVGLLLMMTTMSYADDIVGPLNELDVSAEISDAERYGIPTVSSLEELRQKADDLYAEEDYKAAADAYAEYAEQSNYMCNLISQCWSPYRRVANSSYDLYDGDYVWSLPDYTLDSLKYMEERDRAFVYLADCYYKLNDYEMAVPYLYHALGIISPTQEELWDICREDMAAILEYTPTPRK